jgi:hypothetical protein
MAHQICLFTPFLLVPIKLLYMQMLLDALEEQLDSPATLVQGRNGRCKQKQYC